MRGEGESRGQTLSVEDMPLGGIAAPEKLGTGTSFLQTAETTSQSPFFLVRARGVFNRADGFEFLFLEPVSGRCVLARGIGRAEYARLVVSFGLQGADTSLAKGRAE